MQNITAADIFAGRASLADVHPETCTDGDLRNLKATALFASRPSYTSTERQRLTQGAINNGRAIGAREGWTDAQIFEFTMAAIQWGIAQNQAEIDADWDRDHR